MAELIIAPAARADLLAQWDYFADEIGRPDLAARFAIQAEVTFKSLARTPGLGRPHVPRNLKPENLRLWKVRDFPNHLIFYRPLSSGQGVEIVRVLHGARDLEALFEG